MSISAQILVPVYNEGDNILPLYDGLQEAAVPFESLKFIYDQEGDTTLPFVAQLREKDQRVSALKNDRGPGVINALQAGFSQVSDGPVIVLMGDNSDKLTIIPEMLAHWQDGAIVVSPSRYMRGGEQHGGGLVKAGLSRAAGVSLKMLGFPTADPTNNFKLYDGAWLRSQHIESEGGFEVALELCAKAFAQRMPMTELPTIWRDRTQGESRFRLMKWLPHYLRWYVYCLRLLLIGRPRLDS